MARADEDTHMPEYEWISDDIFTISGFLSSPECEEKIHASESLGFGDAPIQTSFGPAMRKDIRNNSRLMVDDPGLAKLVWERARPYVPQTLAGHCALGVNERFRFYRYDPGQTFRWHRDGYFERPNRERSRLTLMVYLNDDFEGGETRFEQVLVKPVKGTALFFVHHLLHEGAAVVSGRKYVMRTDVMYSG
jgi:predicted 2-oxoglutarate/Fe(II)-dependent dioxygenase YbiX